MSADPSIPPTERQRLLLFRGRESVGSMERSIRCLRSRDQETASNGLETASSGLAAEAHVWRHWTRVRIGWSIVPLHQAQEGCRSKERRYFEGGDRARQNYYSRKPLHFPQSHIHSRARVLLTYVSPDRER